MGKERPNGSGYGWTRAGSIQARCKPVKISPVLAELSSAYCFNELGIEARLKLYVIWVWFGELASQMTIARWHVGPSLSGGGRELDSMVWAEAAAAGPRCGSFGVVRLATNLTTTWIWCGLASVNDSSGSLRGGLHRLVEARWRICVGRRARSLLAAAM